MRQPEKDEENGEDGETMNRWEGKTLHLQRGKPVQKLFDLLNKNKYRYRELLQKLWIIRREKIVKLILALQSP